MSHYTMLSKYGNCTRQLKIKNKLKNRLFLQRADLVIYHLISKAHSWNNC